VSGDRKFQYLVLPAPPSKNRMWKHGRGHTYLSDEARAYAEEVKALARIAGTELYRGPVFMRVEVFAGGDIPNRIDVLADVLEGIAYVDDKQLERVVLQRRPATTPPRVEVVMESPYPLLRVDEPEKLSLAWWPTYEAALKVAQYRMAALAAHVGKRDRARAKVKKAAQPKARCQPSPNVVRR
jgi:Holliday junction resolvase RusA-like endonuclease